MHFFARSINGFNTEKGYLNFKHREREASEPGFHMIARIVSIAPNLLTRSGWSYVNIPGNQDDPNPFAFQDSGNNFTNNIKKWRRTNGFITSFLFIIKSSMSDSTAGRTPKEKFCRLDKVLGKNYDIHQAPLSSEINAQPKMFPFVFALFFSIFYAVEQWELARIMPKWYLWPSEYRTDS